MDSPCFTLTSLESLSTNELIGLANNCGLDIPPGLERIFIIEELLYMNRGSGGGEKKEEDMLFREFKELAVLPKHYNISFIDVLIRDPLWAFVFWEIKAHDRDLYENMAEFEGYCLHVIPLRKDSLQSSASSSFTVSVGRGDSAWYLGFPPDNGRYYKIELCVQGWENFTVLAVSRPFKLPRLIEPKYEVPKPETADDIQAIYQNPLAQLSGADQIPLIRSVDRQQRTREA
ncbi:MAG: DUF4912 domain-containing protein [Treponema sp.]|nr:DUF4912 domain-containing protein [Treponema sp.]